MVTASSPLPWIVYQLLAVPVWDGERAVVIHPDDWLAVWLDRDANDERVAYGLNLVLRLWMKDGLPPAIQCQSEIQVRITSPEAGNPTLNWNWLAEPENIVGGAGLVDAARQLLNADDPPQIPVKAAGVPRETAASPEQTRRAVEPPNYVRSMPVRADVDTPPQATPKHPTPKPAPAAESQFSLF